MLKSLQNIELALTYDDVILVPKHSEIKSRKEPNVQTLLWFNQEYDIPIISSPMNTITESEMMVAMSNLGGCSVLHRYMTIERQIEECKKAFLKGAKNFYVAVGATGDYMDRAIKLYDYLGIRNICVDVANGHSKSCLEAVEALVKADFIVMAGNVATGEGTRNLINAGASSIRVGIGPGSMCKTRVVTGHGVPSLTSIQGCANAARKFKVKTPIIADGGIRSSGDIVKAIAAGADAVMIGGLLAGTEETPGAVVEHNYMGLPTQRVKKYAGMASEEGRKFNGWFADSNAAFVPEGESVEVPYKGPVKDVIDNLVGGLRVGMSLSGARSLDELREVAEFMRVTNAGYKEGTPHGK